MNFDQIIEKRRAVNFFDTEKDVDESLLKKIILEAGNAPSSYNLQPWKLKIIRTPEQKEALRKLAFDQPKVTEAPVTLMVLADRDGWKEGNPTMEKVFADFVKAGKMQEEQREWFAGARQALYGRDAEAAQAFANKNSSLFAMSLMFSATANGLESHPMDGFDHEGVRKEFNIPDNYWIPMLIAIGYLKPGAQIYPKGWRQSFEEIILD
ncbi:nitroreductase family protein [Maridesulfovibrio zosterae]|uniref:nitroreductase family protein n=1 Tax=Maridesulfovibrio zosterae TaxID=82171 RepID=UPI000407C946|nr:nitroreductase family protein [Maridesulfovibrio zosterae]